MSRMHHFAALKDLILAAVGIGEDVAQSVVDWAQRSRRRRHDSDTSERFGLKTIAGDTSNTDIDVCFVHGLGGDWESTWTYHDEKSDSDIFWLRDLLPKDPNIGPSMRILSYGYDTMFPSSEYLTTRTLYHQARELVGELCKTRTEPEERKRPIIFVGHALGGIVIQSAFILSSASGDECLRSVCLSTAGIIFLGTPFRGMQDDEWSESFQGMVDSWGAANGASLASLSQDSKILKNMLQPFIAAGSDIPIYGFQPKSSGKSHQTNECKSVKSYTVKQLPKDLANMGRVTCRTDACYKKVIELCQNSSRIRSRNWEKYGSIQVTSKISLVHDINNSFLQMDPDLPARNPTFINRNQELDNLHQRLLEDSSSSNTVGSMLVVNGPAGIGKTQLVLEYAHLQTHQDYFTSIFWIFAESIRAIEIGFLSIAQKLLDNYSRVLEISGASHTEARSQAAIILGLQELVKDIPNDNVCPDITIIRIATRAVIEWFNRDDNRKWLLILDAVDIADTMEIFPLIPVNRCNHGHVILTRRQALTSPSIRHMPVSIMSPEDSEEILTKLSGRSLEDEDDEVGIRKLIANCSGYPLRLVRAASEVCSTGMSFGEYYRSFVQAKQSTQNSRIDNEIFPQSVSRDWENRVKKLTKLQRKLLNCCCVFPGQPIPWEIFAVHPQAFGAIDVHNLEDGMMGLASRNLIFCNENYHFVTANKLVATWRLEKLDPQEKSAAMKRAWQCIAAFAKESSTKTGDALSSTLCQKEVIALVADSSNSTQEDLSQFRLSVQNWVDLAELCRRRGHYKAAGRFGDCAQERLQDGNSSKKALLRLLEIYLELKATTKAESLWENLPSPRKVASKKGTKNDEAQNFLKIRLKYQSGKIDEAIDLARHSIIHLEDKEGPVNALTLSTLRILVSFLIEKGSYEMAEPVMRRLLLSYETVYGPNDPLTTEALERLGVLFVAQGKLDDAEKSYANAKEQNEKRLGLNHPTTQACAVKLAAVYDRLGMYPKSLILYSGALEFMEDWFGLQHPDVIKIKVSRAEVYMAQREFKLAVSDYRDVLNACEEIDESITMLPNFLKVNSRAVVTRLHCALTEDGNLAGATDIAKKYQLQLRS